MFTSVFCGEALAIFDRFDNHPEKNIARSATSIFIKTSTGKKILHTLDKKVFSPSLCDR